MMFSALFCGKKTLKTAEICGFLGAKACFAIREQGAKGLFSRVFYKNRIV